VWILASVEALLRAPGATQVHVYLAIWHKLKTVIMVLMLRVVLALLARLCMPVSRGFLPQYMLVLLVAATSHKMQL
jgi:hypothetical protein